MRTPIHRTRPLIEFVQVPNLVARDYRLSWRARGLLIELLSYPPGWETTIDDMVERAKKEASKLGGKVEGREAMRAAANELVAVGYIRRRRYQDERGHWRTESELSEEPLMAFAFQETLSPGHAEAQKAISGVTSNDAPFTAGQPEDGYPGSGNPAVGSPGRLTNTVTNTETKNTSAPSARSALDARSASTSGSRSERAGGFAASGNNQPRLTREQKQTVQAVRDLLPQDLRHALPARTPRNVADAVLAALAAGQPRERTPEQLVEYRVGARWDGFWASKFYAGELPKQPVGPLMQMLRDTAECGSVACEDRVDVYTGEPCAACAVRVSDKRAERQAQCDEEALVKASVPVQKPREAAPARSEERPAPGSGAKPNNDYKAARTLTRSHRGVRA